jgi:hypothetical protein
MYNNKKILTIILLVARVTGFGQVNETVTLSIAGTLKDYNFSNSVITITDLTVTGSIDARDVQFMRDSMTVLADLNLSDVDIIEYTGLEGTTYGKDTIYPAHEMPMHSFFYREQQDKTSLLSIVLPLSLTSIGYATFANCNKLVSVTLPSQLTSIGNSAFASCSKLSSIIFPSGLSSIGTMAFTYCSELTSITLPSDLISIDVGAFMYCSKLSSVTFPSGLISIGNGAFAYCSELTSITLPSNLISIDVGAFMYCSKLSSVTFPSGLVSIGNGAFAYCSELTEIKNQNPSPISISETVFYNVDTNTCILKVPEGSLNAYKTAPIWKSFLIEVLGIKQVNSTNNTLSFFPNPVEDILQIKTTQSIEYLTIYDVYGRTVEQYTANEVVSMSSLAKGIYFIKVKTMTGTTMHKIVKR